MSPLRLTCWLSIGSTYTYLTALRMKSVLDTANLSIEVKPISIRQIMKSMDNIPFPPSKQTKVEYMWRDIQRRAAYYKLPLPDVPAPYPLQEFDRANLVGIVMNEDGRYLDYFEKTYRKWFLEGKEAGSVENLDDVLGEMGLDSSEILDRAASRDVSAIYEANTAQAQQSGVFGAPSFSIGQELFWGDDRLEDAIRFLNS